MWASLLSIFFVERKFLSSMECLSIGRSLISVHMNAYTSNIAMASTWIVHRLVVQSSDLRFVQDNSWIVPIQTSYVMYTRVSATMPVSVVTYNSLYRFLFSLTIDTLSSVSENAKSEKPSATSSLNEEGEEAC